MFKRVKSRPSIRRSVDYLPLTTPSLAGEAMLISNNRYSTSRRESVPVFESTVLRPLNGNMNTRGGSKTMKLRPFRLAEANMLFGAGAGKQNTEFNYERRSSGASVGGTQSASGKAPVDGGSVSQGKFSYARRTSGASTGGKMAGSGSKPIQPAHISQTDASKVAGALPGWSAKPESNKTELWKQQLDKTNTQFPMKGDGGAKGRMRKIGKRIARKLKSK